MKTRIRKLVNGMHVAEVRGLFGWKGLWQSGHMPGDNSTIYTEYRWSYAYRFCLVRTEADAQLVLNDYLAGWGY